MSPAFPRSVKGYIDLHCTSKRFRDTSEQPSGLKMKMKIGFTLETLEKPQEEVFFVSSACTDRISSQGRATLAGKWYDGTSRLFEPLGATDGSRDGGQWTVTHARRHEEGENSDSQGKPLNQPKDDGAIAQWPKRWLCRTFTTAMRRSTMPI